MRRRGTARRRTAARPLPAGRLQPNQARTFGVAAALTGITWLARIVSDQSLATRSSWARRLMPEQALNSISTSAINWSRKTVRVKRWPQRMGILQFASTPGWRWLPLRPDHTNPLDPLLARYLPEGALQQREAGPDGDVSFEAYLVSPAQMPSVQPQFPGKANLGDTLTFLGYDLNGPVRSGDLLTVNFCITKALEVKDVTLQGPATKIYQGAITGSGGKNVPALSRQRSQPKKAVPSASSVSK